MKNYLPILVVLFTIQVSAQDKSFDMPDIR